MPLTELPPPKVRPCGTKRLRLLTLASGSLLYLKVRSVAMTL